MKKVLTVLIVIMLISGAAFGQEFRSNNLGILMTFQGLNNLGPQAFDGGGIGAVIHLQSIALRPVFNIATESEKNDDADTETSTFAFGLGCDFLKYLANGRINPYIGAGVGFRSEKTKTENGFNTDVSTSGFLLRGLAGVEIFLLKNFSLMFEYRLTYQSESTDVDVDAGMAKAAASGAAMEMEGSRSQIILAPYNMVTLNFYLGNMFR